MSKTIDHYNLNASRFFSQYESQSAGSLHSSWMSHLNGMDGLALDIGAGSGRDALYLAKNGFEVFAVEPSEKLRSLAQAKNDHPNISWFDDSLPELKVIHSLNIKCDLILLSAVWMHIPRSSRSRAFRKVANLLKPGGKLVITLRYGDSPDEREMHDVSFSEISHFAKSHALKIVTHKSDDDKLKRKDVSWETVVLQLPDDDTGAFSLLRNIIINDSKASTYKLALLRVLLRIADGMPGVAKEHDDDMIALPLGLVSLFWLRQYHRLLSSPFKLQQSSNTKKGLGFVKDNGFRKLTNTSTDDLSISHQFVGGESIALMNTLRDIVDLIQRMPVTHTTYPGTDEPVFSVNKNTVRKKDNLILTLDKMNDYGQFLIPQNLWNAMTQYAVWIEPAIINEWIGLMQGYKKNKERNLSYEFYLNALQWLGSQRNTTEIRSIISQLQSRGETVYCVWTGRKLKEKYEVDHCFPFSRWPNNDLWNLMPSSITANGSKSDKLPTLELLEKSKECIINWWEQSYSDTQQARFFHEAECALPLISDIGSVFLGIEIQRTRLKQMQQLQDWSGLNQNRGLCRE